MTVELLCRDVVFHFNKKHLEDQTIPMWVLKTQGKTFYVNHVDCTVPWSTKETPNNSHTKGAIKVKKVRLTIDDGNTATISELTAEEINSLKTSKKYIACILINASVSEKIKEYLQGLNIQTGTWKKVYGSCGTLYQMTEIYSKEDLTLLSLTWYNSFRTLQENEDYYKRYYTNNTDIISDDIDDIYET